MPDDPFIDLLSSICGALDCQGLVYALTGSVVSSTYGEPFNSQDVDICLRMSPQQAKKLADALPPRFYRSEEAIREAAQSRSMANLIDTQTGFKVDLSVLPDEPYYQGVLLRRASVPYGLNGPPFWMVSPEDIILMKLAWRKDSRSEKQWENALSVMRSKGQKLNWPYLRQWAEVLSVVEDLEALRREAGL